MGKHAVTSADSLNLYVKHASGIGFSAKSIINKQEVEL
jgi:hypothetical protein